MMKDDWGKKNCEPTLTGMLHVKQCHGIGGEIYVSDVPRYE